MRWIWPGSLYGRIVIILVGGMLASQILTSGLWNEIRPGQIADVPLRLLAARVEVLLQIARHQPEQLDTLLRNMESPSWHRLPEMPANLEVVDPAYDQILQEALPASVDGSTPVRLLKLELLTPDGEPIASSVLVRGAPVRVRALIELGLADGQPVYIEAEEVHAKRRTSVSSLILEFFFRTYLLRTIVVVVVALLAVRLALRPLRQMASAAQALGQDIHRPPLALEGPQEVRQASQALNIMQRRLIDVLAERTRMFASVSHDLRTPITRLRLRTELLADEATRERFRADLVHMEEMVSASLDFLRSSEPAGVRELVDINALLAGLQADYRDLGCSVELKGTAQAFPAYASGLRRCLENLMDNAHRHAPGPIEICARDTPDMLRIQVSDRGKGIDRQHMENVFEPLYQVDASRSSGGYGLGLSIAAGIAAAHEGALTLEARDGGGLTATLSLPRASIRQGG